MEYGDRLEKALKSRGFSAYKLSELTGLAQSTLSNYRKNKSVPNAVVNREIASKLGINPSWLDGTSEEFEVNITPEIDNISVKEPVEHITNKNGNVYTDLGDGKYKIFVKKVPVKAFGSYISELNHPEFFDELKQVSFTVDHVGRGRYLCFEVKGESMNGGGINDAPEGAELLCRELGRQHWKDGFRDSVYGWVIVHQDTVLYKDITSFDSETGNIKCHSRSGLPQHPDFVINLNEVKQIWKVIKRSF